MNRLVKEAEVESRGPLSRSVTCLSLIRVFMDDLMVAATSVPGCRWLLQGLEKLITWARMIFKPDKSRSLFLRKRSMAVKHCFIVGEVQRPSVSEKPV